MPASPGSWRRQFKKEAVTVSCRMVRIQPDTAGVNS